jgi:hypothetical protein
MSAPRGPLADSLERYLAHKHSLGKQLAKVGPMLHLLDAYLLTQGIADPWQITAAQIEGFVSSRPRRSPRSYNGLIGAIRGTSKPGSTLVCPAWAVSRELKGTHRDQWR